MQIPGISFKWGQTPGMESNSVLQKAILYITTNG